MGRCCGWRSDKRAAIYQPVKATGWVIGMLSLLGVAAYFWWFYVVTFEEINPKYLFETEPKEGYEYWKRIKFWEDLRKFAFCSLLLVVAGSLPWIGLCRWSRRKTVAGGWDIVLAFFAAIYVALFFWMSWQGFRASSHWFHLSSVFLGFGNFYAMLALIARKAPA